MSNNTTTYGIHTPQEFGAKGDGVIRDDGAITNGTKNFSSASSTFTVNDVGKKIGILGAGVAGATLISTITAFVNATHVTINDNASTTVSAAHFAYGTDDTTALTNFFASILKSSGALTPGCTYISTAKQVVQAVKLECNDSPLVFLIGNNTDNCLQLKPPIPSITGIEQATAKMYYPGLYIDAMVTGLDALFINDGGPILYDLIIRNSYRDAMLVQSNGLTGGIDTYIENMTGSDWLFENSGRHALHLYLSGDGVSNVTPVFINETLITGFEIRSIGRRFANSNAIRLTYDNVSSVLLSANKVGGFLVYGANWDCQSANSLGGTGIGSVVYQNCINGTTGRQVERFRIYANGVENTSGTLVVGAKLITGSAMVAGDWILSHWESTLYQWAFTVDDAFLSSPTDNNTFWNTTGSLGSGGYAQNVKPIFKLPGAGPYAGYSLISTDVAPNGGIIDNNFKNVMTPWLGVLTLVASSNATVDIPISPVPQSTVAYQWPIKVTVSINPYCDSTSYWAWGEFNVLITYDQATNTARITSVVGTTKVPGDVTVSFTPATDVTFSIVSSSGTLRDRLRVTIAGGANVGAAGAFKKVMVMANRWGVGLSELQRVDKLAEPSQEYNFTV